LNLKGRFKVTSGLLFLGTLLTSVLVNREVLFSDLTPMIDLSFGYLSFVGLLVSAIALIRLAQIYIYLYLFFRNMGQGVPRLIANIFTIIFSLSVFGLIGSYVFELHYSTLLTTSAIFSVVLGFALQDTLGNLFSGITFQLDQPFKIGDWVEITSDNQKWLGYIHEITWRATYLLTYSNELVMIPNRSVSQGKVILFSHTGNAVRLNHIFRFPLNSNVEQIKPLLVAAAKSVSGVLNEPPPRGLVNEVAESFLIIKLYYSVQDFSLRYRIGDQVISKCLAEFKNAGLELAVPALQIKNQE